MYDTAMLWAVLLTSNDLQVFELSKLISLRLVMILCFDRIWCICGNKKDLLLTFPVTMPGENPANLLHRMRIKLRSRARVPLGHIVEV